MPKTRKRILRNPVIEGRKVTLLWQGETALDVISDLHGWEANPRQMEPDGPGMWRFCFDLDEDSYLEYAFYNPQSKKRYLDPLNPKRVYNGVGGHNHFFYMPGAMASPLTRPAAGGLRGKVARYTVPAQNLTTSKTRTIYLYQPPVSEAVPLLAVYDGIDYFKRGKLAEIIDNLIAEKRIRPIAVAFLQNAGRARAVEYACAETTLAFLTRTVLPLAAQELKLVDFEKHPGIHGVMGASMGGLMSVYTALCLPQVFGRALSQAGAFVIWDNETITMQMVRYMPRADVRLWLDCGKLDFLREASQQMSGLLQEHNYDFTYRENGGAHNYTTWRDHCDSGLEALFGD